MSFALYLAHGEPVDLSTSTWHLSDLTDEGLGRALILDPGTAHRIVLSRVGGQWCASRAGEVGHLFHSLPDYCRVRGVPMPSIEAVTWVCE